MKRDAEKFIQHFLSRKEAHQNVLLVQGARQVGKTFLVQQAIGANQAQVVINLEKQPDLKMAIDQTKNFAEFTQLLKQKFSFEPGNGHIVFIDEAQESHLLGSYVRSMKEDWPNTKTILTGSSMHALFSQTNRVPVGRFDYLKVFPFSFREFLRYLEKESLLDDAVAIAERMTDSLHNELLEYYDQFLTVGGMPLAVKAFAEKSDYRAILNFLLASQRDDFIRKESAKAYLFLDALRGISNHVGATAKYSHIAQNNYDAKAIVQRLIEWFLVYEIEQRGSSPTQSFLPKRYLYDVGILRLLRDVAVPKISIIETVDEALRTPLGGIIENAILQALIQDQHGIITLASWKKNNKDPIEVDFIYQTAHRTVAIEVKAALKLYERHAKNLVHYTDKYKNSGGLLVSLAKQQSLKLGEGTIMNVPAYILADYLTAQFRT